MWLFGCLPEYCGHVVIRQSQRLKSTVYPIPSGADDRLHIVKSGENTWVDGESYSKKILFTEDELQAKGNLVQLVKSQPHTEIKPHFHKQTKEIYYVLKGRAQLFCGDEWVRAEPGDAFFCEPGEIHGVKNDTEEEFRLLVFKINAIKNDLHWAEWRQIRGHLWIHYSCLP